MLKKRVYNQYVNYQRSDLMEELVEWVPCLLGGRAVPPFGSLLRRAQYIWFNLAFWRELNRQLSRRPLAPLRAAPTWGIRLVASSVPSNENTLA